LLFFLRRLRRTKYDDVAKNVTSEITTFDT
jgi:hypothetical protein